MKTKINIDQLNIHSIIGDRVKWETVIGKKYEGELIDWDNGTAIIKMDNRETKAVNC